MTSDPTDPVNDCPSNVVEVSSLKSRSAETTPSRSSPLSSATTLSQPRKTRTAGTSTETEISVFFFFRDPEVSSASKKTSSSVSPLTNTDSFIRSLARAALTCAAASTSPSAACSSVESVDSSAAKRSEVSENSSSVSDEDPDASAYALATSTKAVSELGSAVISIAVDTTALYAVHTGASPNTNASPELQRVCAAATKYTPTELFIHFSHPASAD
mmetsp:Transcript_2315/g.8062  ORF Transcript_2315/g.8062 Transcript_2315/m.8062 type:complete len:216 (-) Transcript_2315:979-1626(-)